MLPVTKLAIAFWLARSRPAVKSLEICACLSSEWSECGHGEGVEAIGGWRFGNTINGAQAEYLLVPNAQANLAKFSVQLSDEQVVLLADIASTGFSGAELRQIFASATL